MASVVIEPTTGWRPVHTRGLWRWRELFWFLIWRDIKVRYKQTAFGVTWAVLQPLVLMIVFSLFLGRLHQLSANGLPYPLFVLSGLVPWSFFSQALSAAAGSMVSNQALVAKIYFPRLLVPVATMGSYLLDFAIAFVLLIAMMAHYGVHPTAHLVFLPVFVLFALVTLFAVGLLLAALNVRYRDVKYAVTSMIQVWMFLSPVVYDASKVVHGPLRVLYALNPMAGVIEGFRWSLFGGTPPSATVLVSASVTLLLLAGSVSYFQKVERSFADVI